jgi:hypothetical protein
VIYTTVVSFTVVTERRARNDSSDQKESGREIPVTKNTSVREGWTGPGRQDARIEPLQPADDGLHMDRKGMYEWWYFDAHFDNGYTIVVFFHASNPNPGLQGKIGIEIVLLGPDGKRVQKFFPYKKSQFNAAARGCPISGTWVSSAGWSPLPGRR